MISEAVGATVDPNLYRHTYPRATLVINRTTAVSSLMQPGAGSPSICTVYHRYQIIRSATEAQGCERLA